MFDIVTRKFCDPVHYLIHSRDDLLQQIRLFADYLVCHYFVCHNIRKRQNALQLVQKAEWYMVVLVLYIQELHGLALPLLLVRQ